MRLIYAFLLIMALLFLGSCDAGSTAPAQYVLPAGTIQVVTTAPATTTLRISPAAPDAVNPTPIRIPVRVTKTSGEEIEFPIQATHPITITIVYDNNPYDRRLNSAWGFSALVEYLDHILLFDTGGDGRTLLENMRILGVDPTQIDSVVLSHAHEDHTGGLSALLHTGAKPVVYLLPSFPDTFKRQIEQSTQISEVYPGQSFAEGIWTTGEMGGMVPEQALVIQTEQGLVVITGCAHPGIVALVEKAQDLFAEPVRMLLGGFHLGGKSDAEIDAILKDFRRLKIDQVSPCHCTGEKANKMFASEYGMDFIQVGVGSVIRLDGAGG